MKLAQAAEEAWRQLESLVWPVQCAGCGAWDCVLCAQCGALAQDEPLGAVLEDNLGVPNWPVLALGEYEGSLRRVILAAKHDRVRDLRRFLFEAGENLGCAVGRDPDFLLGMAPVVESRSDAVSPGAPRAEPNAGVPVIVTWPPSSRSRERARAEIVPVVAEGVVQGLHGAGLRATAAPILRRVPSRKRARLGGSDTLAGAGSRARSAARHCTMVTSSIVPGNARVLVVDDVCASGATLREAMRALGPRAVGSVVLAVSLV